MDRNLSLTINEVKDFTLDNQSKNITTGIGEAFSNAVKKGIDNFTFPDDIKEKVKEGFEKIDLGEIGGKAAEIALKTGLNKLGIKSTTFNNVKDIIEAVREGDLKKGLSSGLNLAIDLIKIPNTTKSILKNGKEFILDKTFEDELKSLMKKQQNTISRINQKCLQMEEAFNNNDSKTLEKVYKTLKQDVSKVMPIKDVIEKGNSMINRYELYINKDGKSLTEAELELCRKLA